MAFSSSKSFSLLFFVAFLLPSLVFVASSSEASNSCNFDYVFSFDVAKTSVSTHDDLFMNQDFYLSHGLPHHHHQETGSSYLDSSQIEHFLDLFIGLSMEECMEKLEHTLIIINHPGLMYLQVESEFIVLDLVQEVVTKIKKALPILNYAGSWNIVVPGLKPGSLFGFETLEELHPDHHLYQTVEEFRVEFPGAHISHLDYIRTMPKGKGHLLTSLQVPEACQAFLEHKGHLL